MLSLLSNKICKYLCVNNEITFINKFINLKMFTHVHLTLNHFLEKIFNKSKKISLLKWLKLTILMKFQIIAVIQLIQIILMQYDLIKLSLGEIKT